MFSLEVTGSSSKHIVRWVSSFHAHVLKENTIRLLCEEDDWSDVLPFVVVVVLRMATLRTRTVTAWRASSKLTIKALRRFSSTDPPTSLLLSITWRGMSSNSRQRGRMHVPSVWKSICGTLAAEGRSVRGIKAAGDGVSGSGAELMKRQNPFGCSCEGNGQEPTARLTWWGGETGRRTSRLFYWMQHYLYPQNNPSC